MTYYNFVSNQFSGFHGIVIPGTLGESPYLLDGLLEHHTGLQPQQIMTDTAGYSDLIFGRFWLLGFQFSPRLADLGDARLWRIDKQARYGGLHGVARNCLQRGNKISTLGRAIGELGRIPEPLQDTDSTSGSVVNDEAESVFEDVAHCSDIQMDLPDPRLAAALADGCLPDRQSSDRVHVQPVPGPLHCRFHWRRGQIAVAR